jgi:hypothetical protein
MLPVAQRVTMGLHKQVYWESPVGASDVNLRSSQSIFKQFMPELLAFIF